MEQAVVNPTIPAPDALSDRYGALVNKAAAGTLTSHDRELLNIYSHWLGRSAQQMAADIEQARRNAEGAKAAGPPGANF